MKTIWKYQSFLPETSPGYRVHLGEGQTPLIRSRVIAGMLGLQNLYFKLENLNPTGSYKDRFAAVCVSRLLQQDHKLCITTSSGNTGAALAAYCAAAGIRCFVATVEGAPLPKIRQMQLYGAKVSMIRGFGKDPVITRNVFNALDQFVRSKSLPLPLSAYCYCEDGMRGVETIAYEILDELKEGPGHIFCPAGGGGLCLATAKGVIGYQGVNGAASLTKVHCVQPYGNNTIAGALRDMQPKAVAVSNASTAISGLQVPSVLDGDEVIRHCRQLGGTGYLVTDEEVFFWQKELARKEGIFSEPAGSVALAGLAAAFRNNEIGEKDNVVCLITGSGFKDMNAVENNFHLPAISTIEPGTQLDHELTSL